MMMSTWNRLSDSDVRELIEYRDVFQKFLRVEINKIKAQLGAWDYQGKENIAYITIKALWDTINWLEKIQKEYKQTLDEQE